MVAKPQYGTGHKKGTRTAAQVVVRKTATYATAGEGYGVVRNLRAGGTTRSAQLNRTRAHMISEYGRGKEVKAMMNAAKAVKVTRGPLRGTSKKAK